HGGPRYVPADAGRGAGAVGGDLRGGLRGDVLAPAHVGAPVGELCTSYRAASGQRYDRPAVTALFGGSRTNRTGQSSGDTPRRAPRRPTLDGADGPGM